MVAEKRKSEELRLRQSDLFLYRIDYETCKIYLETKAVTFYYLFLLLSIKSEYISMHMVDALQGAIQKFHSFIKKNKNWFSFANILLVAFEIIPFALNTMICMIKKIIE